MKNLGALDRMIRVIMAEACLLAAIFWVGEDLKLPLYLASAVILIPAIMGSCGLYELLGWNSCEIIKRNDRSIKTTFVVAAILLAVVGGFASAFITKSIFIDDLERVNESLEIALNSTNDLSENASMHVETLETTFADFMDKYSRYKPPTVKLDENFTSQERELAEAISSSKKNISNGDLSSGHEDLTKAEPIIRAMIKRQGLP
jgi:phosphate/sulfate permease